MPWWTPNEPSKNCVKSAELRDIINRGSTGSSAGKTGSCDWLRADHRRAGIRIVHQRPGGEAALRIEQIENAINWFGEQHETGLDHLGDAIHFV